jgi:hypothetical protein
MLRFNARNRRRMTEPGVDPCETGMPCAVLMSVGWFEPRRPGPIPAGAYPRKDDRAAVADVSLQ